VKLLRVAGLVDLARVDAHHRPGVRHAPHACPGHRALKRSLIAYPEIVRDVEPGVDGASLHGVRLPASSSGRHAPARRSIVAAGAQMGVSRSM
jgi:hypothetical protein